jgi:hypothetical protein
MDRKLTFAFVVGITILLQQGVVGAQDKPPPAFRVDELFDRLVRAPAAESRALEQQFDRKREDGGGLIVVGVVKEQYAGLNGSHFVVFNGADSLFMLQPRTGDGTAKLQVGVAVRLYCQSAGKGSGGRLVGVGCVLK